MFYPSLEQIQNLIQQKQYKRIPIKKELYADITTPIGILNILKNVSKHCFMLESAERSQNWGRYTFLGFDPTLEITCQNGDLKIKGSVTIEQKTQHPKIIIRDILKQNTAPQLENMPPFTGGLVGYFSYDYIKYNEPNICLDACDKENFKDVDLMLFEKIIAFDHYKQKIILIVNMLSEYGETAYHKACVELDNLAKLLYTVKPSPKKPLTITSEFKPLFDKKTYCNMVEKAKKYIYEGDIFQVVLSNRLEADIQGSLLDTYRVLRTTNPSPYMFYFSSDDIEIVGASPETLVKLQNGTLHTFPLAGTRKRGKTPQEDCELEKELLSDEKEIAEHNMLVDLGRNDIGKISKIGSVFVEKYMSVEKYSHVMHIGSTVKGEIAPQYDALDAIDAILPAGTLSGAPKFRACQIINELENNKRGIYGGALGYLDFTGNLDVCIAIRTAVKKGNKVYVRSGAGIVADSVPENEYQECINKAKAVIEALEQSQGGIDYDITN